MNISGRDWGELGERIPKRLRVCGCGVVGGAEESPELYYKHLPGTDDTKNIRCDN